MGTHTIVRTEIHKAKSALNRQRISFAELTEDETIELWKQTRKGGPRKCQDCDNIVTSYGKTLCRSCKQKELNRLNPRLTGYTQSELTVARNSLSRNNISYEGLSEEETLALCKKHRKVWPRKCLECDNIVKSWGYELCRSCASKGDRNNSKRPEVRAKISASQTGVPKPHNTVRWNNLLPAEKLQRMAPAHHACSRALKGKKLSAGHIANIRAGSISNTPEMRALNAQKQRERWAKMDPIKREAILKCMIQGANETPNYMEKVLLDILEALFPGHYKYVGDRTLLVGGKNPDFVCEGKNLLIELYGHMWHKPEDEQKRIDHFQKFGYSTLVIWADELYKGRREDLIAKLQSFHNSPSASII